MQNYISEIFTVWTRSYYILFRLDKWFETIHLVMHPLSLVWNDMQTAVCLDHFQ